MSIGDRARGADVAGSGVGCGVCVVMLLTCCDTGVKILNRSWVFSIAKK